ncbi:tetratricopeptide repeat protein [Dethiobacter alkaliphilus]|uniref:tetratricopeptide repeat protein n=1 Tax=Dethiobacter alkaliphilus TaxID=427926 RepID=UPI0022272137|nr:tetratricopeptide repeat protein [Dethiobacter alkaliphilus]MCW3491325.1 tetratricopeptide repeat protein [Dethiobacter alkaliphilus]
MTEQVVQEKSVQKKYIPMWKAATFLAVWLFILGFSGLFVGNRYFWSEIDYRQIEREVTYYRQLVEMEPEQPEHRVALGFNLHRLGDHQAALAQLQAAIDLDEDLYDAYLNAGYVYIELEYWDDALEAFQKCVELSPGDYKGYFNLGIVYRELGMFEASYDNLNDALSLRPGATDVLYHLALTAQSDEDIDQALNYLERALAFDPRYRDALALYKQLAE